ncbi:MAG: hypothetical protein IJS20_13105 [Bacteroidales bacterium]|nr:hypothetical protein [Bacteroidales bacterium]MBR0037171.1 hypothetical protein [Bacteroidales bacterium]
MKKNYQKPLSVSIEVQTQMIAGSGRTTETTMGFGGDATEGEVGGASRSRLWQDD